MSLLSEIQTPPACQSSQSSLLAAARSVPPPGRRGCAGKKFIPLQYVCEYARKFLSCV